MIKKPILNFPKISNNIINRHILKRLKSKKPFHNLGENFIERNE